ncbi:hypothetical protein [Bradyrhizobium sp. USDA 313]|uniref:hypothetical protein n=1 Tax=Bradyrhizobium sp. USDA 313 TaxID=3156307 RepID=UPI0035172783
MSIFESIHAAPRKRKGQTDDGGKPQDAAAAWLEQYGFDATGRPVAENASRGDMMTAGRRADPPHDAKPDWIDTERQHNAAPTVARDYSPARGVEAGIDRDNARLQLFTSRSRYFQACLNENPDTLTRRVRLKLGLNLLRRAHGDIRAVLAYRVSLDLEATGIAKQRDRLARIAATLSVSVSTATSVLTRGKVIWDKIARQVATGNESEPADSRDDKREAAAVNEARSVLICATLIELDVAGEIDATEADDKKAGAHRISLAVADTLDDLGLTGERRKVAALSGEGQRAWLAERVKAKVLPQQSAEQRRYSETYRALASRCIAMHDQCSKSHRRSVKSTSPKITRAKAAA